jgi:hypothetical protein
MSTTEQILRDALPESLRFKPSGGCTCRGPYGPCAACVDNEEAWREWMDEPSITPREAMAYARAALAQANVPLSFTFEDQQAYRRRHGMPFLTAAEWDRAVEQALAAGRQERK